jgi:hypothetical protein
MNKTTDTEQIDPSLLILKNKFQGRQLGVVHKDFDREASEALRQMQIDNVLISLQNGDSIHVPLEAFELEGQLYVVDGFHRTIACQQYLAKTKSKQITVPVIVHRGYTNSEAYLDSLTKNQDHGTPLQPSESYQNKFKAHLMRGVDIEVESKATLAKKYGCQNTQGLYIKRALRACIEAGLPPSNEWMKDDTKACKKLKRALKKQYRDLYDTCFDKDDFPIIRKLADASMGFKDREPLSEDKLKMIMKKEIRDMVIKHSPSEFRAALKAVNKELALGLTVKTAWDEEESIKRCGGDMDF